MREMTITKFQNTYLSSKASGVYIYVYKYPNVQLTLYCKFMSQFHFIVQNDWYDT